MSVGGADGEGLVVEGRGHDVDVYVGVEVLLRVDNAIFL